MSFRSQQMAHYQMIIPREGAWDVMQELGQIELAHVVDCGDNANRPFFSQLKRCDEALQKIQFLIDALSAAKLTFQVYQQSQPLFVQKLHQLWAQQAKNLGIQQKRLLDKYQNQVIEEWRRFQDTTTRIDRYKQNNRAILQQIACLEAANQMFGQSKFKQENQQYYNNNNAGQFQKPITGISFLIGVVPLDCQSRLNKMIYRASRGYACVKTMKQFRFAGLKDFKQIVTLVIYPSSDTTILQRKLKRVMQTFCNNNYVVSKIQQRDKGQLQKLKQQFDQTRNLIELQQKQLSDFFQRIKKLECLENWRLYFWKERHLYSILDRMEIRQQFFRALIFVPQSEAAKLSIKLNRLSPTPSLHQIPSNNPPTAFKTNSYTVIAQQITDTYGVPRYEQINPTVFTVVTFPFFFGVMFGDIAHGGILFLLGIYLVFNDQQIKRGKFKMFSSMRYMITMMGFFAFYCGWIYNDFIGMNINIFGSCFDPPPKPIEQKSDTQEKTFFPRADCVYPIGVDPIWGRASNQLVYVNALKMKISVIIAVIHMSLGICVKAANSIYFKKTKDLVFQFIPQIIFMVILFGYMDFLIIFKWLKPWDVGVNPQRWAPSIISTMMNIGLKMGKTGVLPDGNSNMWGQRGNTSQDLIQIIILLVAFICIPIMLLPKPIIQIRALKEKKNSNPLQSHENLQQEMELERKLNPSQKQSHQIEHHDQAHGDAGQIFVHQLIQTIQFVLGAISNTASYLRLWALSLAHSQLAKVFFEKTLMMGYGPQIYLSIPFLLVGFYLLCWITFGILMCMDTMQCFLHSLRLHWVQFQNKFYKGDGYKYQPFSFRSHILENKAKSI